MNSEYLEDIIVRINSPGYSECYSFVYSRRENIWIAAITIWETYDADLLRPNLSVTDIIYHFSK